MPKYGVISGPYFPVFGLNTGEYRPEITTYLDTFHAVIMNQKLSTKSSYKIFVSTAKSSYQQQNLCINSKIFVSTAKSSYQQQNLRINSKIFVSTAKSLYQQQNLRINSKIFVSTSKSSYRQQNLRINRFSCYSVGIKVQSRKSRSATIYELNNRRKNSLKEVK